MRFRVIVMSDTHFWKPGEGRPQAAKKGGEGDSKNGKVNNKKTGGTGEGGGKRDRPRESSAPQSTGAGKARKDRRKGKESGTKSDSARQNNAKSRQTVYKAMSRKGKREATPASSSVSPATSKTAVSGPSQGLLAMKV